MMLVLVLVLESPWELGDIEMVFWSALSRKREWISGGL